MTIGATSAASLKAENSPRPDVTWFGDVPSHWHTARLKDVAHRIISGGTPSSNEPAFWNGDVVWITPQDISKSQLLKDSRRRLTSVGVAACGAEIVPAGSVIVTTRAPVGNVALAAVSLTTNQGCKAVVPKSDALDSRFGFYLLNTSAPVLRSVASGSTFQEISSGAFSSISIPLPPLPEQQAIARFLDRQDRRISRFIRAKQRLIALLAEQKQAIIHQAVTRGLDPDVPLKPSGIDWLGDVPAHWDVRRLKDVGQVRLSGVDKHTIEGEQSVVLCNYTDVYKNNFITNQMDFMQASATEVEIAAFTLRTGDVLITKDSETPDDIGVPAVVQDDVPGLICGYHLALIRPYSMVLDGSFLFRSLSDLPLAEQFHVAATGVTRFGLSKYDVKNVFIPLPGLAEQREIVAHLASTSLQPDAAIARARREIELIREYRTRLIADVVTGKLDVRNHPDAAEDAPDDPVDDVDVLADDEMEELDQLSEIDEEVAHVDA